MVWRTLVSDVIKNKRRNDKERNKEKAHLVIVIFARRVKRMNYLNQFLTFT